MKNIDIDKEILENIDKEILENIDKDKISIGEVMVDDELVVDEQGERNVAMIGGQGLGKG